MAMRTLQRCLGRLVFWWVAVSFLACAIIPYPAWATPMVAITQPPNGATVATEIWVDAVYQSSTDVPIVRLELLVDDAIVHNYVLPTPRTQGQQSFSYSFRAETGQLHRVAVKAIDSTGGVGQASIQVTVKKAAPPPGAPDQTPPVVNVYYPHDGQEISGDCEVKVDARDNSAVEWVFVYIDNRVAAMIKGNPPYVHRWDTRRADDGQHVIQARAWDANENEGQSAPITVRVANRQRTSIESSQGIMAPTGPSTVGSGTTAQTPRPVGPVGGSEVAVPAPVPVSAPHPGGQPTARPAPAPTPSAENVGVAKPSEAQPPRSVANVAARPAAVTAREPATLATEAKAPTLGGSPAPAQQALPIEAFSPGASRPRHSAPAREGLGTAAPGAPPSGETVAVAPAAVRQAFRGAGLHSTTRADMWAAMVSEPELFAWAPESFGAAVNSRPARILVLRQQFIGDSTILGSAPPAAMESETGAMEVVRTEWPVRVGFLVGSPEATMSARTLATPVLEAVPCGAEAVQEVAPAPVRERPVGEERRTLPTLPPGLSSTEPVISPQGLQDAETLSSSRGVERPAMNTTPEEPERTTGVPPRPTSPRPQEAAQPQGVLAPRTSEVYLLAMLPSAGRLPSGSERSSRPGTSAAVSQIMLVPSVLARFDDVKVLYDGKLVPLRVCPEVTKGVAMGPLREIFEQSDGVLYWFHVEKRVKAVSAGTELELRIGVPVAQVNGQPTDMELSPYIKQGRTMVPLSFLAATLGLEISFDSKRGQLIITPKDM